MAISLEEIKKMVEKDMKIDPSALDSESLNTPQIHNKYLSILLDEKLIFKRYESTLKVLRKNKWLYYSGKMSEEQMKELEWESFDLALLRVDLDRFIERCISSSKNDMKYISKYESFLKKSRYIKMYEQFIKK